MTAPPRPAGEGRGPPERLLRPLLLTLVLRLRPDLEAVAVESAVARILSRLETSGDPCLIWSELDAALTDLARPPGPEGGGAART